MSDNLRFNINRVSKGSLIVAVLTVLFVLGLIFLPELVQIQSHLQSGTEDEESADGGLTPSEEELLGVDEYAEELQEEAVDEGPPVRTGGAIDLKKLTWEQIRSAEVMNELDRAKQLASEISSAMDRSMRDVIFALQNLIDGIERVQNPNSERWMSPREALRYLQSLDVAVTDAMLRANVPRSVYERWTEVSIGKALGSNRSELYKLERDVVFQPEVQIVELQLSQKSNKRTAKAKTPSALKVTFQLRADSVKRIAFFRNNRFAEEFKVGKPDKSGFLRISPRGKYSIDGSYTVVVFSTYGDVYRRTYAFYPRARGMRWEDGVYRLPYAPGDPALDNYFSSGTASLSDSPYSIRFGSQAGTTF